MFVYFTLFQNIIIPVLVCVLAAAAAAAVFFILRARRKKGTGDAADKKLSKKKTLRQCILTNIDEFSEMFEPVYSVSVGKNKKQTETFASWNEKVLSSPEDNGYKAIFAKLYGDYDSWGRGKKKVKVKKQNKIYKKKAKKLVKTFFKAGIVRGADVYETGCETTAERYDYVGSGSIETDKTYEVLAPCWTCGDKVVDKGVIR